jgi:two-component system, NarL family, sensor histidine kinase DevS
MDRLPIAARELLASTPDAILVVDSAGRIRWCNDATTALFGYEQGELHERPVELLVPDTAKGVHAALRAGYEQNPTARPMGRGRRLHGQRADGTTFVLQIALSPLEVDGEHFAAAIARDMTDFLEAERRIDRAQRRQSLAEDRERIARDLHDTVIQELFAAGMALQAVVTEAQPARVAQRLSDTIDAIDDIIRTIRDTIFRLQQAPEASTRAEALEDLMASMAHGLGFLPVLRVEGDPAKLSDETAAALEVVCREALSNVARHAQARSARVEVHIDDDLTIVVTDDGVGLPDPLPRSSGLANLRVRATALGGTMDLGEPPGGGTTLCWRVPTTAGLTSRSTTG